MPPLNRFDLTIDVASANQAGDNRLSHGSDSVRSTITAREASMPSPHDASAASSSFQTPHHKIPLHRLVVKSVRFDETNICIRHVVHRCDWDDCDKTQRWHSAKDYLNFRRDIFHTLYLLRNHPHQVDQMVDNESSIDSGRSNNNMNDGKVATLTKTLQHTARGVECRMPGNLQRRLHVKQTAWQAVWKEQALQRHKHHQRQAAMRDNPRQQHGRPACHPTRWIASLYRHACQGSAQEAIRMAAWDRHAANEYYYGTANKEDETMKKMTEEWVASNSSDEGDSMFTDDWIRSVSSLSSSSSLSSTSSSPGSSMDESESSGESDLNDGCNIVGEPSGFDDGWIRMDI